MKESIQAIDQMLSSGEPVAIATVVATRGSAPRPVGSKMVISTASGEFMGSVSGGCVEADVCQHAVSVVSARMPMLLTYGIADDFALGIGLPCGGEIDVFVEPMTAIHDRLCAALPRSERGVLFTVLEGPDIGAKLLVDGSEETIGEDPYGLTGIADDLLKAGQTRLISEQGAKILAEVYGPPPRLVVYGAVDLAQALAESASMLGWRTVVADARASYLTPARIPSADELVPGWPEEAFEKIAPDAATAIVILTHDEKFDQPALLAALASEAFYIGALGSRRTQENRQTRLRQAGVSERDLERIAGPCGLDIGGQTPPETAISIVGEILAVRTGKDGGRLRDAAGRIHPVTA